MVSWKAYFDEQFNVVCRVTWIVFGLYVLAYCLIVYMTVCAPSLRISPMSLYRMHVQWSCLASRVLRFVSTNDSKNADPVSLSQSRLLKSFTCILSPMLKQYLGFSYRCFGGVGRHCRFSPCKSKRVHWICSNFTCSPVNSDMSFASLLCPIDLLGWISTCLLARTSV